MQEEDSNSLIETEFFWYSLLEGDRIVLEADYFVNDQLVLHKDHAYDVLAKTEQQIGHFAFVVQSDVTQQLVNVHPFLVSDYHINPEQRLIN